MTFKTLGTLGLAFSITAQAQGSLGGEQVVDALEPRFAAVYSTSGFKTERDLVAATRAAGPLFGKAVQMLSDEDVEISIATPENLRLTLARGGIKNYHETESSNGAVLSDRDLVEAAFLHIPYDEYVKTIPDRVKVKYAFLSPKIGSGLKPPRGIFNYGKDRFVLKLSRIKNRLTLTVGDSLNYLSPQLKWVAEGDHSIDFHLDNWAGYYIPWRDRLILAPLLAQGLAAQTLALPVKIMMATQKQMDAVRTSFPPLPLAEMTDGKKGPWTIAINEMKPMPKALTGYKCQSSWGLDYFEAQIWDEITPDDYAAFEFTGTPPSGEFLEFLNAHHIEIRDGRTQPAKLYARESCGASLKRKRRR